MTTAIRGTTSRNMIINQVVGGSIKLLNRNITCENKSSHRADRLFFINFCSPHYDTASQPAHKIWFLKRFLHPYAKTLAYLEVISSSLEFECSGCEMLPNDFSAHLLW